MDSHGQPFLDEDNDDDDALLLPPKSLMWSLYLGHFLSRWSARMWEFSVALYMINIWPNSLLLTAIYGVVESTSVVLFGPIIGEWVDRLSYVKVLRICTLTQNMSFAVAGGTVIALLVCSDLKSTNAVAFASLVAVTDICGAVAVLSTLAGTILIERVGGCDIGRPSYRSIDKHELSHKEDRLSVQASGSSGSWIPHILHIFDIIGDIF